MLASNTIARERSAYTHFTEVTLRYSDQDPMNHINNVAISAFLESGRVGFFNHFFREIEFPPRSMVLASMSIDYLHEILFPRPVEVGGRIAAIGSRSIRTQYAIFQGGRCCVVSESINVFFDPVTRRSAPPPDSIREFLDRFQKELVSRTF